MHLNRQPRPHIEELQEQRESTEASGEFAHQLFWRLRTNWSMVFPLRGPFATRLACSSRPSTTTPPPPGPRPAKALTAVWPTAGRPQADADKSVRIAGDRGASLSRNRLPSLRCRARIGPVRVTRRRIGGQDIEPDARMLLGITLFCAEPRFHVTRGRLLMRRDGARHRPRSPERYGDLRRSRRPLLELASMMPALAAVTRATWLSTRLPARASIAVIAKLSRRDAGVCTPPDVRPRTYAPARALPPWPVATTRSHAAVVALRAAK